jgi:hypothetical protein
MIVTLRLRWQTSHCFKAGTTQPTNKAGSLKTKQHHQETGSD